MKVFLSIALSLIIIHNSFSGSKDNWTPKDIIQTEFLRNAVFSPSEDMVVWSKRIPLKEKDKFVSKLFLTRLDGKKDGKFKTLQLTRGEENDYNPLFSKKGEKIYFLSSREKSKVLWSLDLHGGEAEEVHKFENGISNIQWKNDSILQHVGHLEWRGTAGPFSRRYCDCRSRPRGSQNRRPVWSQRWLRAVPQK